MRAHSVPNLHHAASLAFGNGAITLSAAAHHLHRITCTRVQVLEGQGFAPLEQAYRRMWLHEGQPLRVAPSLQADVAQQVCC